jgi:heat-inducible transcriptional repressor
VSRPPAPQSRHVAVLHSIVEEYIESGEPVASRTIAKRIRENISAATVRNIMADLYEDGYLSQPHTSAGRVPTEKGFRSYIKSLTVRRMVQAELERIRYELTSIETVTARVERTSHLLMEMTRGLAIAAAIPTLGQTLDQVDLLALADRRVLMIVATRDRMVHNRVVVMNEPASADELQQIRNYINQNFSGWLLNDVRRELEVRLSEERATYDSILRRLNLLYDQGLLDFDLAPEIYVDGTSNLIGFDLHLTQEKMRDLFRALEQKKKILHLLERFCEEPHGEVAVRIGLSEADPAMSELAIIGVNLRLPGGAAGKFAVVGPMRMDYERAISAVLHVGQAFQSSAQV